MSVGYENVKCHFCSGRNAAFARTENGKDYDACFKCAREVKLKGDEEPEEKGKS